MSELSFGVPSSTKKAEQFILCMSSGFSIKENDLQMVMDRVSLARTGFEHVAG